MNSNISQVIDKDNVPFACEISLIEQQEDEDTDQYITVKNYEQTLTIPLITAQQTRLNNVEYDTLLTLLEKQQRGPTDETAHKILVLLMTYHMQVYNDIRLFLQVSELALQMLPEKRRQDKGCFRQVLENKLCKLNSQYYEIYSSAKTIDISPLPILLKPRQYLIEIIDDIRHVNKHINTLKIKLNQHFSLFLKNYNSVGLRAYHTKIKLLQLVRDQKQDFKKTELACFKKNDYLLSLCHSIKFFKFIKFLPSAATDLDIPTLVKRHEEHAGLLDAYETFKDFVLKHKRDIDCDIDFSLANQCHQIMNSCSFSIITTLRNDKIDASKKIKIIQYFAKYYPETLNKSALIYTSSSNLRMISATDHTTLKPLEYAVMEENEEDVKLLIESGAPINDTESPLPALHLAIAINSINMVSLLIHFGADVSLVNSKHLTALHYVKSTAIAKFIIINQFDETVLNQCSIHPLQSIAARSSSDSHNHREFLDCLDYMANRYKEKINVQNGHELSPLHKAIIASRYEQSLSFSIRRAEILCQYGADTNLECKNILAEGGNAEFIYKGKTPLQILTKRASSSFFTEDSMIALTKILLKYNLKINPPCDYKDSPFSQAIKYGYHRVAMLLLKLGATSELSVDGFKKIIIDWCNKHKQYYTIDFISNYLMQLINEGKELITCDSDIDIDQRVIGNSIYHPIKNKLHFTRFNPLLTQSLFVFCLSPIWKQLPADCVFSVLKYLFTLDIFTPQKALHCVKTGRMFTPLVPKKQDKYETFDEKTLENNNNDKPRTPCTFI